mgnify:CR=1 FL=1
MSSRFASCLLARGERDRERERERERDSRTRSNKPASSSGPNHDNSDAYAVIDTSPSSSLSNDTSSTSCRHATLTSRQSVISPNACSKADRNLGHDTMVCTP